MKYKTISYELLNSELNYRLNDKRYFLKYKGLSFSDSKINPNMDLIMDEYGTINYNKILLTKINSTKYRITINGYNEDLEMLYYYLNDSNERIYVDKEDVEIKPDGTLIYNNKIVKTYYKSDSGFILSGDYSDFINSNNLIFKNEDILNLEQEIFNINSTIEDLTYQKNEYEKMLDNNYSIYTTNQKDIDQLSYDILDLQVQLASQTSSNNISLYNKKNQYYNKIRKTPQYSYGLSGSNLDQISSSVCQYMYYSTNGFYMDNHNLTGFYTDGNLNNPNPHPTGDKQSPYNGLNDHQKIAKYYEQLFTYEVEEINQGILYLTNEIEQTTWTKQQQINAKQSTIKTKQLALLNAKNALELNYDSNKNTYYSACVLRNTNLINYYNKLKTKKEYELSKLKQQIPVLFLINNDKSLIYGFNEFNKLSVIFDKYENQLLYEYNNNLLIRITSNDDKKIEFKYNSENDLINIINDVSDEINIIYDNDRKVISISDNDNNLTTLSYTDDKLTEVIDNGGIGYRINNDSYILRIDKINQNNEFKELHNYNYQHNYIILTDKTRYVISNNNYIYSKYEFIFDNNDSLLTEIEYKNDEIINISGYEYDSNHCNFKFDSNKDDKIIYETSNGSIDGISQYNITLPQELKTDYLLYSIVSATSYNSINEYRKTAYCNHVFNIDDVKFEMKILLAYPNETIKYGASYNPKINRKQLLAIPVTLKEDTNGKAIRPNSITVYIDYTDNNGTIDLYELKMLETGYNYQEYNNSKQVINNYKNDILYPIIENGVKTGYVIKSSYEEYEYNINELLSKKISYTNYEQYDLNNNLINNEEYEYNIKYYYDNNSNLIKTIDSKSNVILYELDDKGNITKEISYNENNSSNRYIKESKYDEKGILIKETNDLGYEINYKNTINDIFIESPNGFIISESESMIKSDLISNSNIIKNGKIYEETSGNIKYKYEYDNWGYETEFKINGITYMTFSYSESSGMKYYISKLNDNTGYKKITDLYDKLLCIKKICNQTEEIILSYNYDSNDNLISIKDKNNNIIESYDYTDNVLSKITNNNYIKKYSNDIYNNQTNIIYDNDNYQFEYDLDNNIISLTHNDYEENINYDSLKRIKELNSNIISNNYEYLNINNRSTNLVKQHKQIINNKVIYNKFEYDKCGNIIKTIINHNTNKYYYDGLNRLIRCDLSELNHTYTYLYDENNNIISKGCHDLSYDDNLVNSEYVDYNYDKDNKLLSYGNNLITYDNTQRPINYKNNVLEWDNNKLTRYGNNYFEYDYNGLRTKKTTSADIHTYIRDNNKLLKEIISVNNTVSKTITYNYGINGIIGFTLNSNNRSKDYYYIKNIFNDVVEIIDENYNTYAKYSYDSFGICNIITNINEIATINPIRYRSYYYDIETNLYYLNTRYYDPVTMRFISLDNIEYKDYNTLGGLNLFVYCNNNPIMNIDPDGNDWWSNFWKIVGAIAIIGISTIATIVTFGGAAALLGVSTVVATSMIAGAAIGGLVAGGIELAIQISKNGIENIDLMSIAIESVTGAALGAITGAISSTTSLTIKAGMRLSKVGISVLNSVSHDISSGQKFNILIKNALNTLWKSAALQSIGAFKFFSKVPSNIIEFSTSQISQFSVDQVNNLVYVLLIKDISRHIFKEFKFR